MNTKRTDYILSKTVHIEDYWVSDNRHFPIALISISSNVQSMPVHNAPHKCHRHNFRSPPLAPNNHLLIDMADTCNITKDAT